MTARCFVDTNVLVYARDASEPEKQPRAAQWVAELWASRAGRLSTQVLNEFYVTVTRKLQPGLASVDAWSEVRHLMAWQPVPIDPPLMEHARSLEQRHSLSWWDALVVAAARREDCRFLLTEDLQDQQNLDGTLVVNPFRHRPDMITKAL